ncbi:MAG: tRNA uridine-5-carboxymethylaminomethyl(34) synthesis GTPase MnmE [Oscillospiraceae bacterium]|nr:tRNA uridine-5-carboxymethylaminomethyl(34) synthesis GTPase MnmE [Oscillospiraceae bacterium]
MHHETTIAAISTPIGTGGIGIIRISGTEALAIASRLFRPYGGKKLNAIPGYSGCPGRIFDKNDDIDEAIAFVYHAPKSYTGEDTVELSCHGGVWLLQRVLRLCLENGAAPAQPGEFTKRAFLNGKLDLMQAEAVMGIISAEGDAALKAGMSLRDGALSKEIRRLTNLLVDLSAHLGAWADYPEEDLIPVDLKSLETSLSEASAKLQKLVSTYDSGSVLRHGISTAIVGKPNTGKSTLMNLLSRREKSIVTDIPGTTRDIVEDTVHIGGFTLRLCDTAGIRETENAVEKIGVDRAKTALERADLVLAVFDGSEKLTAADLGLLALLKNKTAIAAINKTDLPEKLELDIINKNFARAVKISAQTGFGLEALEKEITDAAGVSKIDLSGAIVTTQRQRGALAAALSALQSALAALSSGMTLDIIGIDLDEALAELLALTGDAVPTVVVDALFAKFCVGK